MSAEDLMSIDLQDLSFPFELMSIDPQEISFPFELKKQMSCSFQLSNKTDDHLAFKVKTTDPKKYCVRPNSSIVLPRSIMDIIVTMQAQKEAPPDMQCKDKFLVQCVVAPPGATPEDINREMFNDEDHHVEECKLKVVFADPPRPSSPVPEETEEETLCYVLHMFSGERAETPPHELFKSSVFNEEVGNDVEECILEAVNVDPPRPPSPVPEEHEEETSKSSSTVSGGYAETHDTSSKSAEQLLSIDPLELRFPFELNKQIFCFVQVSSNTDSHLAFKVKTTNPKKYSVRPNSGILLPRSIMDIIVSMQALTEAPPDMQCKDKFLVQYVVATPGATQVDYNPEMFNEELGNHVEACKLNVVFVDPSRPSSPVPEESEEETSESSSTVSTGYAETHDTSSKAHQVRITSSWLSGNIGDGELPELIVGMDLPIEELKAMLLEDKVPVQPKNSSSVPSVVLLSAPPGCGKTMLAKMMCGDSTIKDKFKENIFFVTVSKRVTVKVIVKKVFQQTGLNPILELRSERELINRLRKFLQRIGGEPHYKPILLVLDDVRSPGLKSLVHKFMFEGIQGYKILVTSRFDPLGFQSVYRLKLLNHQDAMVLFRHYAFLPGRPYPHVPDYLVNKIVKGCKGFPLALTVLGLSLCGKHGFFWKNTLNKWSTGKSDIFDSNSELLNNLKTILDVADEGVDMEKVKECFLHLRSFHEDQTIPATAFTDSNGEFLDVEDGMDTYNLAPLRSSMGKEGSFFHVFLSFRGEIRNDFTCYLYDALKADGFIPFMDKRDVDVGDDVQLSIEEGIKNSMSAIVIFSKDYASSPWCLDELILILERKRTSKYFFFPILFGVKSADVKHQLGSFKEALEKHKTRYDEERIEKWRATLKEAGKYLAEHFNGTVPDFIQNVVKLFRKRFSDNFAGYPMPSPQIPVPH